MLRDANNLDFFETFFELGRVLFTAQNKRMSFDFFRVNPKDYFTHHSEIPDSVLDERNLYQVSNNT